MSDQLKFTLHHPITEDEWDAIADVDFDHTDNIFFHTKNGKEVEFVKRKKGKWIAFDDDDLRYDRYRCTNCRKTITVDSERRDDIGFTIEDMNFCPNCGSFNGGEE